MLAAVTPTTSWSERLKYYGSQVEELVDAPVDDLAAVIGVDVLWLGGLVLGIKFLASGLLMLNPKPHRRS